MLALITVLCLVLTICLLISWNVIKEQANKSSDEKKYKTAHGLEISTAVFAAVSLVLMFYQIYR